ncbi:MAG: protein-L-isoaspartate(D-aspartate) O-methyltransferase [Proteobacteria bacterium]|nr:protein-L-isoaspartate(D-aspartate) O-methyltransferase [Pseudomonadota bacterium]MBU1714315.1 protein-L-isoaspartate(D-aspartate) O-methyltransferase [Pseudomonadota bacterium]
MNNYEKARERMILEQLVPRGIIDQKVLEVMGKVPRHLFVEDALQAQSYSDFPLPIGEGQTISQPYIVALMTQMLNLRGDESVLEIGTGSGYQAAVLSRLCERVFSVERIKPLFVKARKIFDQLLYFNILCKIDDGTMGWPANAPYDAIMVTAAGPDIPQALVDQLADPGRMVIPIGDRTSQRLTLVTKEDGEIKVRDGEAVRFVSLIGAQGWEP